jgi:hypothetical protein
LSAAPALGHLVARLRAAQVQIAHSRLEQGLRIISTDS